MIISGVTGEGSPAQIRVSKAGEAYIKAETAIQVASAKGAAYCWPSLDTDIDAGDTRLFIKNTGDRYLKLTRAIFSPSNVACKWDVGIGVATTTATGTAVAAVAMNAGVAGVPESYVAWDDETAVADATKMFAVMSSTVDSLVVPLDGIVLPKNSYIQINQKTESTSGQVAVFGYFTDEA
jgi:hypothetical protein